MSMQLDYQVYSSPQGWYTLQYPEYWEMEVIEGVPAFFDPEGAGAIVVSAFENKEGNYNPRLEMKNFLYQHGIQFREESITTYKTKQGTVVQTCEFISKDRFWFVHMMSFDDKLLLLTYNSDEIPEKELSQIISHIVSSLQFKVEDY